jgi:hypothetical protein
MNQIKIDNLTSQIKFIYEFGENKKSDLKNLFFDLESEVMESKKIPESIFDFLTHLIDKNEFSKGNKSTFAVMFISNVFDKFNTSQKSELYLKLFDLACLTKSSSLLHLIGDFVARKYPTKDAIDFCNKILRLVMTKEEFSFCLPLIAAVIFILQVYVDDYSIEDGSNLKKMTVKYYSLVSKFN